MSTDGAAPVGDDGAGVHAQSANTVVTINAVRMSIPPSPFRFGR
ncbi:MAG: hypothetical protein WAU68_10735 [Vitreimonas sp.]